MTKHVKTAKMQCKNESSIRLKPSFEPNNNLSNYAHTYSDSDNDSNADKARFRSISCRC